MKTKRLTSFIELFREDVPTTSASSGNIAGIGVGQQGEPGGLGAVMKRLVRRKRLTKNRG